jgi:hypothetical protein
LYGEDFGLQIESDFGLYLRPSGGSQPLSEAERQHAAPGVSIASRRAALRLI